MYILFHFLLKSLYFSSPSRAVKCYKKAFTIHPGLTEAGISLGECLSALGEEVWLVIN